MHLDRQVAGGLADQFGAVLGRFHRVHVEAVDGGERAEQRGLAAGARAQIEPAAAVGADEFGAAEAQRDQLTALVLHGRHALAHGLELAGIAALQVHRVGRPAPFFAAGDQGQFFGGDFAGPRDQVHDRAFVVGGEQVAQFARVRAERVGEGLGDPGGVRVLEREPTHRIGRRQRLDPLLGGALARPAQHGVHESRTALAEFGPGEFDGGVHGRVRADPGAQQLVAAQAQDVEQRAVDLGDRPARAFGDHRVQQPLGAARAVGEFRGERGVASVDAALAQKCGQHEVGVRVALADGAQDFERRLTRRIDSVGTAPTGTPITFSRTTFRTG